MPATPHLPVLSHLTLSCFRTLDGGPPPAPSVAHACSQLTYLAARCLHPAAPLPDPPDLISCLISVSNVGLWARELSLHVE